jgi:hypothetical protein
MLQPQFDSPGAHAGPLADSGPAIVRRTSEHARSQRVLGAVLWCYLIGTVLWISS